MSTQSNLPALNSRTLTGVKLSSIQMSAIRLLINRDSNTTLSDIASSLEVSIDLLNSWLRDPKFANELQAQSDIELYANIGFRPKVVHQLMNIAFADPSEFYNPDGTFRDIRSLPKHLSSVISEFTVTQIDEETKVIKIKTEPRTRALQILAQHFGLIRNQVDFNFSGSLKVENSVAPIDSIPKWLQMVLLSVMSGKEISQELQNKLLQELESVFDADYNVIDSSDSPDSRVEQNTEYSESDFFVSSYFN